MNSERLLQCGVVGVVVCAFLAAYILNAYGQWHTTGTYIPPNDLIDIFKFVLGASVGVITLGSMPSARKALGITSNDDHTQEIEDKHRNCTPEQCGQLPTAGTCPKQSS